MYKLILNSTSIGRLDENGAVIQTIPNDPTLAGWAQYQDWLAEGNTPEPADPIIEPIVPQWEDFNIALLTNPLWIGWGLMADLRTAIISASATSNLGALQSAYNIAKVLTPAPPEGAIEAWQAIADAHNIEIVF